MLAGSDEFEVTGIDVRLASTIGVSLCALFDKEGVVMNGA